MKLIHFLTKSGIASRRKSVELFDNGLILVNGKKLESVFCEINLEKDIVTYKNKKIIFNQSEYYILNKPMGYVCSNMDQFNPMLAIDLIPTKTRIFTVGRLDKNTTGLIIITNDGDFANKIIHPSNKIRKTYEVTINSKISKKEIDNFNLHITQLGDIEYIIENINVSRKDHTKIKISIFEGKKHIIRKLFKCNGYQIESLKRIAIGGLELNNLKEGKYNSVSKQFLMDKIFI